jgi:hypothetical protein
MRKQISQGFKQIVEVKKQDDIDNISDGSYFEEVRKLNKQEEERRQEKFIRINDDNVANA